MDLDLDLSVVGRTLEAPDLDYTWRDCAIYALGVGACSEGEPSDLEYVWEGSPNFKVLPSFAVVPTQPLIMDALHKINANYRTLVHGEQTVTQHAAIPSSGTLKSKGRISAVYDKGKGAVVLIETATTDAGGRPIFDTLWSIFCRGQGGFGGDRGPSAPVWEPKGGAAPVLDRTMQTHPNQAVLYRLNGDLNPLHVDPNLATKVGFKAPILHGLCTFGFATRAAVDGLCGGDPARLRSISGRFSAVVYPGAALRVRALRTADDGRFLIEALVGDATVLGQGVVEVGT